MQRLWGLAAWRAQGDHFPSLALPLLPSVLRQLLA